MASAPPPPSLGTAPPPPQVGHVAALAFGGTLAEIRRPSALTAIAVWDFLQGGVMLLAAAAVGFVSAAGPATEDALIIGFLAVVYLLLGSAHVAAGVGLLGMKSWGRILQIVLASIGLIGFPCGTLISIFILIYMLKPGIKILFSGKTGELTPEETAAVANVLQSNSAMWVIVVVVALLVVVAVIGIIAAIAIPSLLRARISANESGAIGSLRTIVSAQAAVASANNGQYVTAECLRQPESCVANWPAGMSTIGEIVFDVPARGYVLRFHPGPIAPVAEGQTEPNLSHITSFAVTATPASAQSGVRRFCADDSGIVATMPEGVVPLEAGRCPDAAVPLR